MRDLPANPSASVRRRNPQLYGRTPDGQSFTVNAEKPTKRVRQSVKPLTALEEEWGLVLRSRSYAKVRAQAKTYRLGNGVRYTPDWTAVTSDGEIAWEVKGKKAWDDAIVKIKMAPTVWPEVTWWLVWKDDAGKWQEQKIIPSLPGRAGLAARGR